ncbi:tRNA (adenosine(37)-N6)-dimethylallyltransferase MiaA [Helicobacter turcicus]|uniref:tRNA dimethylallyltransferase n=1 Tax=Helicobacter turcicus TaxID=2867412 RepID=A0ABS7JP36_9HELI|nr:tRNA (adenosine(37)-N6)-dimethylallyltransferase MiaA [Helicobacter turcicus]MBX7491130.1 tRNA (adenosine(37)-N6)-dimethylallyltransferase MiaA [Helicobacter turcicus]MBX7545994.1 tRNA (adenosine(37)-N6)-dimethylallyltransferase MiaA [Helicobacter turcicus]
MQTQQNFKTLAILGGSGSGKTALSLEIAKEFSCAILSLDSLSIYKEIDIASAKPSLKERGEIVHFGIDVLSPKQVQNVQNFIAEFKKAQEFCIQNCKHLLIVGGTSFYLKSLLCGISPMPKRKATTQENIRDIGDLAEQYAFLCKIDSAYAKRLQAKDSYRIIRALEIYFDTQCAPSVYFKKNPPYPILKDCAIFDIMLDRAVLQQKIALRTKRMLEQGLIAEIEGLVECYGEAHQWAKSIGIKEVLAFKRGEFNLKELESLITTHTAQLAKRQRTFNKTQFLPHFCGEYLEVREAIRQKLST